MALEAICCCFLLRKSFAKEPGFFYASKLNSLEPALRID